MIRKRLGWLRDGDLLAWIRLDDASQTTCHSGLDLEQHSFSQRISRLMGRQLPPLPIFCPPDVPTKVPAVLLLPDDVAHRSDTFPRRSYHAACTACAPLARCRRPSKRG